MLLSSGFSCVSAVLLQMDSTYRHHQHHQLLESQNIGSLQTCWIRICILPGSMGDPYDHECLRSTVALPLISTWLDHSDIDLSISPSLKCSLSHCISSSYSNSVPLSYVSFLLIIWYLSCFCALSLLVKSLLGNSRMGNASLVSYSSIYMLLLFI